MTINDIDSILTKCTGCSACFSTCPKHAIEMAMDHEGFLYPSIDKSICVNCSLCLKVCPIKSTYENNTGENAYAGYANSDIIRKNGSSGGIFGLLAESVIEQGGVVFGAVFDPVSRTVKHLCTDDVSLSQILKSKYVESNSADSFVRVNQEIAKGRMVLFCGTPCQVKGLYGYLGTRAPNLLTVDFMCHGKPSTLLFQEMLKKSEKEEDCAKITNVTFREKRFGWRNQHIVLSFSNGKEKCLQSSKTPYYFFFLNSYSLRTSCYTCTCYNTHVSDFTLADYWESPGDDDKGISLIICNSEHANEVMKSTIEPQSNVSSVSVDYTKYAHTRRKGYDERKHKRFFRVLNTKGYDAVHGRYYAKEHRRLLFISMLKKSAIRIRDILK